MKRILLIAMLVCAAAAAPCLHAQAEAKLLRAAVSLDVNTRPATKFSTKAPQLVVFYAGDKVKTGEKVRAVWFADNVGTVAPKNTKITESTITATEPEQTGEFSLERPPKGWTPGFYRVELYVQDRLAETLKFEIALEE